MSKNPFSRPAPSERLEATKDNYLVGLKRESLARIQSLDLQVARARFESLMVGDVAAQGDSETLDSDGIEGPET